MAYGLPAVTSFAQITSNVTAQKELQAAYGSVDNIDLFAGLLIEDDLPGMIVGETLRAILVDLVSVCTMPATHREIAVACPA